MTTTNERLNEESDRAIAEFLAKGGKIEHAPIGKSGFLPGQATTNMWGRKTKAVAVVEQIEPDEEDLDEESSDELGIDVEDSEMDNS